MNAYFQTAITPHRLGLLGIVLILGCGTTLPLPAQTQGELFRKLMLDEHTRCKSVGRGPYAPSEKRGENRRGVFVTDCDLLLLDTPQDPTSTVEGRQAQAIKLPYPHDQSKTIYKPGMNSAEYFKALCETEAGEFIFKTIDNVESVFEMRPRVKAPSYAFQHLYYLEDPYGHLDYEAEAGPWLMLFPERYKIFEKYVDGNSKVRQFSGYHQGSTNTKATLDIDIRTSQYGFTWRGIDRPKSREHGIAGGELIVLDLTTNAVLGFRRGFAYSGIGRRGAGWEFAQVCPRYNYRKRDKDVDFTYWFVGKVLRSSGYEIEFKKLRGEMPWN